jgi:hypothetical protein
VRCPTCNKEFDPQASRTMPFCSDRCRQIDLKRWLGEEISIPYGEVADDGLRPQDAVEEPED